MKKKKRFKRLTKQMVKSFKEKLDSQFGQGEHIEKVSAQIGITRNALQQAFKKQVGLTIREYKLKLRMERGMELLYTGKEIKEISQILHYTTPRAFTHAFKKHFGVTPTDYADSLPIP